MAKSKAAEPSAFALVLGERIKKARGDRTLQEIADATGGFVHPRMLANYESGTEPRFSTLVVIAAALGVKLAYLVSAEVMKASDNRDATKLVELVTD